MKANLNEIAHRPWPLPEGTWVMGQSWLDLLFAHWPVDAAILRPRIPMALEIDTYRGQAWVGVVPFRMEGVRLRGTPALPRLSAFPELNVRTYVVAEGKPGVWFFSLDAANWIAVAVARAWFHLPYFRAWMSGKERSGWIEYQCERTDVRAPRGVFHGRYRAVGESFCAQSGSLEYFLTERYCLYAADQAGRVSRSEVHHGPWTLQRAEAEITCNTMAEAAGIHLPTTMPLLHFSRRQNVVVWPPIRLKG